MTENVETVLIPTNLETPAAARKASNVKFVDISTSFDTEAETPDASRFTPGSLNVRVLDDSIYSSASKTPTNMENIGGMNSLNKKVALELDTPPRHSNRNRKMLLMTQMLEDIPSPVAPSPSEVTNSTLTQSAILSPNEHSGILSPNSSMAKEDESFYSAIVRRNLVFSEKVDNSFTKSRTLPADFAPAPVTITVKETPVVETKKEASPTDTPQSQPGRILPFSNLRDDASWCSSSIVPFDEKVIDAPPKLSAAAKFIGLFKRAKKAKKTKETVTIKEPVVAEEPAVEPEEEPVTTTEPVVDSTLSGIQINEAKKGVKPSFFSRLGRGSARNYQAHQDEEDTEVGKEKPMDEIPTGQTFGASQSMDDSMEDIPSVDLSRENLGEKAAGSCCSSWTFKKFLYYVIVPILLLGICAIVGVLVIQMFTSEESEFSNAAQDSDNTVVGNGGNTGGDVGSPTAAPSADKSGGFGGGGGFFQDGQAECKNAKVLEEISSIFDNMMETNWDDTINMCGDGMTFGFATWYKVEVDESKYMEASTCDAADFDTQITVMSGNCNDLNCVTFNDNSEFCGDTSKALWYAEQGTTYYVVVSGFRDSWGVSTLTVTPTALNDECSQTGTPLGLGSIVSGTTVGSSIDDIQACGNVDMSKPGVWYDVANVKGPVVAELLNFDGQVSVFQGGCDALTCVGGSNSGIVSWDAKPDKDYLIYVNGVDAEGNFDIFVGRSQPDTCADAPSMLPSAFAMVSSTTFARPHSVESCGLEGFSHSAPGLWYTTIGNGNEFTASTCGSGTSLDTEISVFKGSCDELECVGGSGEKFSCDEGGSVVWPTVDGEEYFIYVSGRGFRVGDFWLTLGEESVNEDEDEQTDEVIDEDEDEEVVEEQLNDQCGFALPIASETSIHLGSNVDATLSEAIKAAKDKGEFADIGNVKPDSDCKDVKANKAIWYSIVGTGGQIIISTCSEDTDFNTVIDIFAGSCEAPTCIISNNNGCGDQSVVSFTSVKDVEYFISVRGDNEVDVGNFSMGVTVRPVNFFD